MLRAVISIFRLISRAKGAANLLKQPQPQKTTKANPLLFLFSFSGCFCLTEARKQPQQFFRVKPQDIEVGQGGNAVVPCEVSDRRGRVQWTKDGLTLGTYCHVKWIFSLHLSSSLVAAALSRPLAGELNQWISHSICNYNSSWATIFSRRNEDGLWLVEGLKWTSKTLTSFLECCILLARTEWRKGHPALNWLRWLYGHSQFS